MFDPLTWILIGIGTLAVVAIGLSLIQDWLKENTTLSSEYGELIKKKLDNGDYRVIAGVFDKNGTCTAKNAWEGTLEDDLKAKFGERSTIRVTL